MDNTLTVERAGVIALTLVNKNMSASETAFFVAGFQECIKYLNSQHVAVDKRYTADDMIRFAEQFKDELVDKSVWEEWLKEYDEDIK